MAKYHNKKVTKLIGKNITRLREAAKLEIEDLATMTGFHRNVIISIENGSNTDISHIIAIAFALNLHPMEILNVPVTIKSRNPLPPGRREKNRLTSRINILIKEGFFNRKKTGIEIRDELRKRYPASTNIETKNISVILARQVKQGKLKVIKSGQKNLYQTKRS